MENYYQASPDTPRNTSICSLQFSETDKVRLHGIPFPEFLIIPLRSTIESNWRKGIQDEGNFHGAHQFKLKGNPWTSTGKESIESKSLLAVLLKCMAQNGWTLLASCDPTKKFNDKDVLFFENAQPDPGTEVFAVGFGKTDRIRLIAAQESWLVDHFKEVVANCWTGIQHIEDHYGSTEVKLRGNPWYTSDGKESIATKLLMCQIIAAFRRVGYKLYASVDISGRGTAVGSASGTIYNDLDVWVFRKVTGIWH